MEESEAPPADMNGSGPTPTPTPLGPGGTERTMNPAAAQQLNGSIDPSSPCGIRSAIHAKRTYTSGEYLAIKRQKAANVHIPLKSNNLQDSSELTARVRKFSSVMGAGLPFSPTQGNSTNMVKWRDASVVQAMKEGQAYRASTVNSEPIKYPLPCSTILNQFTDTEFAYPTSLQATIPTVQNRGKYWIGSGKNPYSQPFSLKEHFGMANEIKNTKLYVPNPQAVCRSCDLIEK